MIVIADTSPINYLVCINEIAVLPKLYGAVIIPPAVRDELGRQRAPESVRLWISDPPAWLEVRRPTIGPDAELISAELDSGEFEAILLAEELGASQLILDDMEGRKEAERRHIHEIQIICDHGRRIVGLSLRGKEHTIPIQALMTLVHKLGNARYCCSVMALVTWPVSIAKWWPSMTLTLVVPPVVR
jgi:predicted nucleic acid-binding protein